MIFILHSQSHTTPSNPTFLVLPPRHLLLHYYYSLSLGSALLGMPLKYIPHTGIFIHGLEYFYGGGIQAQSPAEITARMGMRPMEIQVLGRTSVDKATLRHFLSTPAMVSKFSPMRYDLFTNNCNHFSDVVAKFLFAHPTNPLLSVGIPLEIVNLPQRVAATPMGAQIMSMWGNAAGAMRSSDPFGSYGDDDNEGLPPPSGAASISSSYSSQRFPASNIMQSLPPLITYIDLYAAHLGPRLRKADAAVKAAGSSTDTSLSSSLLSLSLTREEGLFADTLTTHISAGGDWADKATLLATRVLRDWPRTINDVAFSGLLLARLALSQVDRNSDSGSGGGGTPRGALSQIILDGLLSSDIGWGSAPVLSNMALMAIANSVVFNKVWALHSRAQIADIVSRELTSVRLDHRKIAASIADALARTIGSVAAVDVSDGTVVHLLAAVLGSIENEEDSETITLRLYATGTLCLSPLVANLASELGLDTSLDILECDVSRSNSVRALSAEISKLIRFGSGGGV